MGAERQITSGADAPTAADDGFMLICSNAGGTALALDDDATREWSRSDKFGISAALGDVTITPAAGVSIDGATAPVVVPEGEDQVLHNVDGLNNWHYDDVANLVTSVAGKTGAVNLDDGDIAGFQGAVSTNVDVATNSLKASYPVADAAKLATIEPGADVTDDMNVAGAGAVMDTDIAEAEGLIRKTGPGAYEAIKTNLAATAAPVVTDDVTEGYAVGSRWIDLAADKEYVCVDAADSAAIWVDTTQAGGGGGGNAGFNYPVEGLNDATRVMTAGEAEPMLFSGPYSGKTTQTAIAPDVGTGAVSWLAPVPGIESVMLHVPVGGASGDTLDIRVFEMAADGGPGVLAFAMNGFDAATSGDKLLTALGIGAQTGRHVYVFAIAPAANTGTPSVEMFNTGLIPIYDPGLERGGRLNAVSASTSMGADLTATRIDASSNANYLNISTVVSGIPALTLRAVA